MTARRDRVVHTLRSRADAFMATHPWDHNAHHHDLILRRLPRRFGTALDVGCGTGEFARHLAARCDHVDAIDPDPGVLDRARLTPSTVRYLSGDLLGTALRGPYDVVTALAVVHHLPLEPALHRLRDLVAPGGTLVILGLARESTPTDHLLSALAVPANLAVGAVKGSPASDPGVPTAPATETLARIRTVAAEVLPGARVRRHLFWRHSLVWRRSGTDLDGVVTGRVPQR